MFGIGVPSGMERGTPLNNSIDMKRDWVIRKELCRD
jgi:hypothetical protein